jgi:hypothetical protein
VEIFVGCGGIGGEGVICGGYGNCRGGMYW